MISKNGIALIVMVISFLGGNVAEADLTVTLTTVGQIVSLIVMAYNQYGRGNVDKFIFKK